MNIFHNRSKIFSVIVTALILGVASFFQSERFAYATHRFLPGQTLDPGCPPTDPDCSVETMHYTSTYVVTDISARDALSNVEIGDHVQLTSTGQSFVKTQGGMWQELSSLALVRTVSTEADLSLIADPRPGDMTFASSTGSTFVFTQDRTWFRISRELPNRVYIVADAAALAAISDPHAGDHAEVAATNQSLVRTEDGTWQEILAPEDRLYVVADTSARDVLVDLHAGDVAVVTALNKTYFYTQGGTWEEMLASPSILRLSNTYVVADEATRDALTGIQSGDLAIVTSLNDTYVYTQSGTWQQLLTPTAPQVSSVNGLTGLVNLNSDNINEGLTHLYYSNARARGALSVNAPLTYDAPNGLFGFLFSAPFVVSGSSLGLDASQVSALTGLDAQESLRLNPWGAGSGNTAEEHFAELSANGTNYVGLKAPDALPANTIWTLPSADGSSGQVLSTNGAGVLSWTTPSGGGGSYSAGTGLQLIGTVFSVVSPLDTWVSKTPPSGAVVGTTDTQVLSNKTFDTGLKIASQAFSSAGTNDTTPEWNGSPIVKLTGSNITQTFNLGACASNANEIVSIYVRDTNNKARTINGTSAEGIIPFTGGAKANFTMKNSANGDNVAATFYCDGADWMIISLSQR